MKRNLLKTLLVAAGLLAGTSGTWAQITSLPVNEDFEDEETSIFEGGELYSNDNVGGVLRVYNGTATATFSPAYTFSNNEKVTFQFTAYQGWTNSGTHTVSINNSEGNSLVSYTYDLNKCQVTDVSVGGSTVAGFASFFGQSYYSSSYSANGFTGGSRGQYFQNNAGYNPVVTISITNGGHVEFNLAYTSTNGSIDETYAGQLSDITVDLGSMTVVSTCSAENNAIGIDNLSITSEITEDKYVTYTLQRVCGETVLSSESISAVEGSTVTVPTADYTKDDKKYIYVSDDVESVGVAADGNVYTITYREAEKWNYTVNAVDGSDIIATILTGNDFEGTTIAVPFGKYYNANGTLFETTKETNPYYSKTITLTENNQVSNISCAATSITNVVYFSEGEDIEGATVVSSGNTSTRSSYCKSGYSATDDLTLTKLPAGKYTLTADIYSPSSAGANFVFYIGTNEIKFTTERYNSTICTSEEITITEESDVVLAAGGGTNSAIDYLYIVKTGEATENVSVGTDGLATYVAPVALDFTNAQNIAAYTAKVDNENATVTLTKATTVAKGEGVLLRSLVEGEDKSANEDIAMAATAAENDNDFIAVTEDAVLAETDGEYTNFVLSKEQGVVGFFKANNTNIAAGKAYLKAKTATVNEAKGLKLVFDGEATGISEVNASKATDNAYYTLSGVRVQQPTKGLYIVNGKKVVIK